VERDPDADPDGSPDRADGEPRSPAFTFEGQIERLQRFVVGINRRGGRDKRVAQVLVVGGLALLALLYLSGIVWGIVG
jgi:hypothetical protein